jgi:myosin-crossreactive antigen
MVPRRDVEDRGWNPDGVSKGVQGLAVAGGSVDGARIPLDGFRDGGKIMETLG